MSLDRNISLEAKPRNERGKNASRRQRAQGLVPITVYGGATPVKIADMQVDPVKGTLIHMDLMRISLTEKSKFEITIKTVGESEGVKSLGAILEVVTHSLEVRCLPGDLPSIIEVDVTPLGIGDKFKVGDLKLDGKVEILDDPETVIATVVAPRVEEPAPEAAPEAAAEPEVIKKGKAEEAEDRGSKL